MRQNKDLEHVRDSIFCQRALVFGSRPDGGRVAAKSNYRTMAPPRPTDNKLLEYTFRFAVRVHVALYGLTGGRIGGRSFNAPVLLLTTKGRKTGKPRTIPLIYLKQDHSYVLVASFAGSECHPIWYVNLQADPHATIQVMTRVMSVTADTADPAMRSKLWPKLVAVYPDYEVYQTRTDREIPVVLLKLQTKAH